MKPATSATVPSAPAVWPDDAIEVGRILGAWGIKGWFKVQPFATDPQAMLGATEWLLKPSESTVPQPPGVQPATARSRLEIVETKEHAGALVALAKGVSDRTAAQALYGARIFVSRAQFPKAGVDEFYWVDLIGLDVVNREGVALGRVVGLIDTGPHSVLRVLPEGAAADAGAEAERLIPFVSHYVDDVSLAQRRITVDWAPDF
jgi:16S rRNA processing protein RimM